MTYNNWQKYIDWIIVGCITVLAAMIRLWDLGGQSLRLDEAQSVWQASHSLAFIRDYMIKNVHLPLHNSLLHVWMRMFGTKEYMIRLLAVIPGIVTVPAMYALGKEFLEKKWAIYVVGVAAVAPFWVWYSREIRMYSLLVLFTVLSYYCFVKILKNNQRKYYLFYTLVNMIGIYIHYFFLYVLLVQIIFFFSTWKISWHGESSGEEKKKMTIKFGVVAVVVMLTFAPWVFQLMTSHGSGSLAPNLQTPSSFNIFLSFFEFGFGYQPEEVTSTLMALWPLTILVGFLFLMKRERVSSWMWLLVLGILVPMIATFIVSTMYTPMFLTRYLIVATPPLFIFLVWIISEMPKGIRPALVYGGMSVLIVMLINQLTNPNIPAKENYRAAALYVSSEAKERDIVVLSPPYLTYPFLYYYQGGAQVTTLPIWDKRKGSIPIITNERLEEDVKKTKANHRRIFLLVGEDLDGGWYVKEFLNKRLTKFEKKQFSEHLWLHVYQAEYSLGAEESKARASSNNESGI